MKVDAHHHIWDPEKIAYCWLNPSLGVLYRAFDAGELEPLLHASGINAAVLVQAMDSYEETDFLLQAAARYPWIRGVVGWVPLDRPAEAEEKLREYVKNPVFKGIRPLINLQSDPDWIVQPDVLEGMRVLARFDMSLDVVAEFPKHLKHVPRLARENPTLRIVIDHLAKPPIKDKGWEPWAGQLAEAAKYPNVYAKVSGLNTVAPAEWSAADLKPYVDHARDVFGAHRLMFGSDWPVSLLAGDYAKVWKETNAILQEYPPQEAEAILGWTAERFYRLG